MPLEMGCDQHVTGILKKLRRRRVRRKKQSRRFDLNAGTVQDGKTERPIAKAKNLQPLGFTVSGHPVLCRVTVSPIHTRLPVPVFILSKFQIHPSSDGIHNSEI
jgi:hypothetical protein